MKNKTKQMKSLFHLYKEHKKTKYKIILIKISICIKFHMYHLAREEGTVDKQAPPQQRSPKERNNCFVHSNEQKTKKGSCMKK